MTQVNLSVKQKQTCRHREQTCGCQGGGAQWGVEWEFGAGSGKLFHIAQTVDKQQGPSA